MLFTCSFPRNASVEAACCNNGPKPESLSVFTLGQEQASYCAVNDNIDDLLSCLADHSITIDECRVQNVDSSATTTSADHSATSKSAEHSSASPGPRFGTFCALLLGLSMLAGVSADSSNSTTCKSFSPGQQSDWDYKARTTPQSLDGGATDCRGATQQACSFRAEQHPSWKAEWSAPSGVEVLADVQTVIKAVGEKDGKKYAAEVTWPATLDRKGWKVVPRTAVALTGSAAAIRVSGTFGDCDNKQTYEGSIVIPRSDEFWYKINREE